MILYVWQFANGVFTRTNVIDNEKSVIWVKRFNDTGQFELYIPASTSMIELFTGNEIIITRDDSNAVMSVENVHLKTDAENGDYLTISGRSVECFLGRRIVPKQTTFQNTTAENVIRSLINQNVIDPPALQSNRKIDLISLGTTQGYTDVINKQVTGKNLLDTISAICKEQNYGFELTFDNGQFVFNLYKGVDRSYNQNVNTFVVFSPEFENIGNTEYSKDKTTLYNAVYVGGEGEGTSRVIVGVGTTSGLTRREKWVDARNESSNTDAGTLTPTEYALMLSQQGAEAIKQATETTKFNGEIINYNSYVYGVDYNLGDIVQVTNEYGITGTATVTEITEVEDDTGYKIYPTLSEWSV